MMGFKYYMHNALMCGAVASRPRLLGLVGATVDDIPKVKHFNPSFVLEDGWYFENTSHCDK